MNAFKGFIKREPVLVIAAAAAAISCFFIPPDKAYLDYVDFRTIALLYCLMTVVAGAREAGAFERLAGILCARAANVRIMGVILTALSFFSSMLITNDVALLTFVPFSAVLLGMAGKKKELLYIVVLQTAAANLGSMLTPVGNPQNLYLYSYYGFGAAEFFGITAPAWALSLVLILLLCLFVPGAAVGPQPRQARAADKKKLAICLALFAVCLLTVFRVLPWYVMLGIVVAALLIADRKLLIKADFMLLLTFAAFFIFAGNLARIDAVDSLLRRLLSGREYLTGLVSSQVISNVPAALLLSGFTENGKALLLGVNIGGLGTPVASLASLISLKLYSRTEGACTGKYMLMFLAVNILLLALLSAFCLLLML